LKRYLTTALPVAQAGATGRMGTLARGSWNPSGRLERHAQERWV